MYAYYSNAFQQENNTNFPYSKEIRSLDDLLEVAKHDHVMAQLKGGYRDTKNFRSCSGVVADLDNDHTENPDGWKGDADVIEAFPDVRFYIVYSRHHQKEKPKVKKETGEIIVLPARYKAHIYFPLSKEYTDIDEVVHIKKSIACLFPYFDPKVIPAVQQIFGVENPTGKYVDGRYCIDEFIYQ